MFWDAHRALAVLYRSWVLYIDFPSSCFCPQMPVENYLYINVRQYRSHFPCDWVNQYRMVQQLHLRTNLTFKLVLVVGWYNKLTLELLHRSLSVRLLADFRLVNHFQTHRSIFRLNGKNISLHKVRNANGVFIHKSCDINTHLFSVSGYQI